MLVLYTEDMHDTFTVSTIELIRHYFIGRIVLIIPFEKSKRIGYDFFSRNQVDLIEYKIPNKIQFLNRGKLLGSISYFLDVLKFLYFDNYQNIFFNLNDFANEEKYFLALEAFPYGGNKRLRKIFKNYDFLNKTLVLHDTAGYKSSLKKLIRNKKPKSLLLYFLLRIVYRNELLYVDKLIVLNSNLKAITENLHNIKTFVLPPSLPSLQKLILREEFLEGEVFNKFILTVPGSVSDNRRDYVPIINALSSIDSSLYELVFLGKVENWDIIALAQENRLNLIYFDHFVGSNLYEEFLLKSHFIIYSPINSSDYGVNMISGIPYDAFRYGIPLINLSKEIFSDQFEIKVDNLQTFFDFLFSNNNVINYNDVFGFEALNYSKKHDFSLYASVINEILS